ncbi:unnamed protein product [Microthlaspi erraticum]|uniref:Uncharacterized protein n=1 Tax=Microthlaspi erraticum TaxID=1685480 RepID=A0A6D2HY59_9BRAS|nr:unnamed protein product [Microthlaspi erraticum]
MYRPTRKEPFRTSARPYRPTRNLSSRDCPNCSTKHIHPADPDVRPKNQLATIIPTVLMAGHDSIAGRMQRQTVRMESQEFGKICSTSKTRSCIVSIPHVSHNPRRRSYLNLMRVLTPGVNWKFFWNRSGLSTFQMIFTQTNSTAAAVSV